MEFRWENYCEFFKVFYLCVNFDVVGFIYENVKEGLSSVCILNGLCGEEDVF